MLQRVAIFGMLWASSALAPASFAAASESYEIAKWEAGAAMPGAIRYFGMVRIPSSTNSSSRGHVMVAGGYDNDDGYLDSVYMLDLDAGTWSGPVAAMPGARGIFGMVHIPSADGVGRGHVMVAGGRNNGGVNINSVYMLDLDAGTWSGPAAAMPGARHAFEMVHIPSADGVGRGQVMVAGGHNKPRYLDSVYMYNVDAGTWSGPAAAMPGARYHFGMVRIPSSTNSSSRGHVMVAGGYNNVDGYLDSVYMYNVDAGTWSGPAAAMPGARRAFEMVRIPSSTNSSSRGHVMVAGGYNNDDEYLDSVYMYNVDAGTWSGPAAAMPVRRENFGMVHIPSADSVGKGQVMVAGGLNNVDGYLDSVYLSAPVTTTTTTTTTTVTTTSTTTASTTTVTTTTTTATTTTATTTTWLGVNAKCDPLADACASSDGLACAADVYECRYAAATLESQICAACTGCSPRPGSSAGVAVLAVLLILSLAANVWMGYANRSEIQKLRQQQFAEQELNGGGGGRRQTVEMVANPLARRSSGLQSGRAAAALPPPEAHAATAALYAVPTSDDTQTHASVGPNYAPVYAVYAGPTAASTASAGGVPLDSDNYVLDTSA